MPEIAIVKANLSDPQHQSAVLCMMDAYSADPMGDAKALSDFARLNLISGLRTHPTTLVFLAFHGDQPCGSATCFRGFSTFAAKPLINISDLFVDPVLRGQGIRRLLLEAILEEAKETACCKITLEVQQNNSRARSIYGKLGFKQAVYAADTDGGGSLYMARPIKIRVRRTSRSTGAAKSRGVTMEHQSSPPRDRCRSHARPYCPASVGNGIPPFGR